MTLIMRLSTVIVAGVLLFWIVGHTELFIYLGGAAGRLLDEAGQSGAVTSLESALVDISGSAVSLMKNLTHALSV